MISIYKSSEVKPHIIQLLKNEGLNITEDNIKIWAQDTMLANQVKLACDHIKSKGLAPVLVYTNKVPMKSYLQEHEGVRIFDEEDLTQLSIRHDSPLLMYF